MRRRALTVFALMLCTAACAGPGPVSSTPGAVSSTPTAPSASRPVDPGPVEAPEWRRGDRWTYEWVSGSERGSRIVEVVETTAVNGVDYYVLEIGPTSQQYYTKQLHFAASVQASRVLARMTPPQPWFIWPLKIGARWDYRGVYQEQQGSRNQTDVFAVAGIEDVAVPGGTFRAYKIVRQTSHQDADQYWYAPEVRWYVRWIGRRGVVDFEESLKAYQPVSRATSR